MFYYQNGETALTIADKKAKDVYKKLADEIDHNSKYNNLEKDNEFEISFCSFRQGHFIASS